MTTIANDGNSHASKFDKKEVALHHVDHTHTPKDTFFFTFIYDHYKALFS